MEKPLLEMNRLSSLHMKRRSSLSNYDPANRAYRNSISKGVKHGDISMISKKSSYKGIDEDVVDIADSKTEEVFDSIRKKFDRLKKETLLKEKSIEKAKESLENAKQQEQMYLAKRYQALQVSGDLQRGMIEARSSLQHKNIERLSLEHIMSRLKADMEIFKDKGLTLEGQYKELSKLLKLYSSKDTTLSAESTRAQALLQILRREMVLQKAQRDNTIEQLRDKIQSINNTKSQFDVRDNEIRQIAERAIQDKDQNEKEWRRLLLTNKFVSKFLQNKMHIQMEKFNVTETAFKNIKIATGVNDGPTMVTRYLEKEKIYGRLLDSIAKSQKQIETFKHQRENYLKQKKGLQNSISQIGTVKKSAGNVVLGDQSHRLDHTKQRNEKTEICVSKLSQWLNRQHKKISSCTPGSKLAKFSKDQLKNNAEHFLLWLQQQAKSIKGLEQTIEIDMDVNQKTGEDTATEAQIGDNQLSEENDLIDTDRGLRIKKDQKFFQRLRKERQEKAYEDLENEAKLKFTKLEKAQKQKSVPVKIQVDPQQLPE